MKIASSKRNCKYCTAMIFENVFGVDRKHLRAIAKSRLNYFHQNIYFYTEGSINRDSALLYQLTIERQNNIFITHNQRDRARKKSIGETC